MTPLRLLASLGMLPVFPILISFLSLVLSNFFFMSSKYCSDCKYIYFGLRKYGKAYAGIYKLNFARE